MSVATCAPLVTVVPLSAYSGRTRTGDGLLHVAVDELQLHRSWLLVVLVRRGLVATGAVQRAAGEATAVRNIRLAGNVSVTLDRRMHGSGCPVRSG